ncbi:hypothetical protein K2173_010492 [Erythroxylum novogranatense]|uniref:Reverse transcriptase zinc-binding domain-containing protein n=1 Tax=Erythroxylum novogranatense TaxID=1862640 RepID=A0AAV8TFJ6_9ROSI|nr:hypothetical protein K2173_010492 [Erythroxylum novogranatense]
MLLLFLNRGFHLLDCASSGLGLALMAMLFKTRMVFLVTYGCFGRPILTPPVYEMLDHAASNVDWRISFPNVVLHHLPRVLSDHCPLLLKAGGNNFVPHSKPFRFEAAWLSDSRFDNVVYETWDHSAHPTIAFKKIKQAALHFNKHVFGNIFHRKRSLLARLRRVQTDLQDSLSSQLHSLEQQLITEYNQVLAQEEASWFQKSREHHLLFGDRNTRYFHALTVVRRRRNKIDKLKLIGSEEWCDDGNAIKQGVFNYFSEQFGRSEGTGVSPASAFHQKLGEAAIQPLLAPVTAAEVHTALFSMRTYTSPGPDEFQLIFFKTYWAFIGSSVTTMVQQAFASGDIVDKLIKTLLVLLPKEPKSLGGLGLRDACTFNITLLGKAIWALLTDFDKPWVQMLDKKYIQGGDILSMRDSTEEEEVDLMVSDVLQADAQWDWGRVTSSAVDWLTRCAAGRPTVVPGLDWMWIWQLRCPEKVRFLAWLIVHERVHTQEFRDLLHLDTSGLCRRCLSGVKSMEHLFRDCLKAHQNHIHSTQLS